MFRSARASASLVCACVSCVWSSHRRQRSSIITSTEKGVRLRCEACTEACTTSGSGQGIPSEWHVPLVLVERRGSWYGQGTWRALSLFTVAPSRASASGAHGPRRSRDATRVCRIARVYRFERCMCASCSFIHGPIRHRQYCAIWRLAFGLCAPIFLFLSISLIGFGARAHYRI